MSGDKISFLFENEKITRTIKGLDLCIKFSSPNDLPLQSGILIECKNEAEIENLKNWKPNKIIAEIYSEKENGL